jgi:AraC-like DNA-binding protein
MAAVNAAGTKPQGLARGIAPDPGPKDATSPSFDVLSALLETVHVQDTEFSLLRLGPGSTFAPPIDDRVRLFLVTSGAVRLAATHGIEPLVLDTGDLALLVSARRPLVAATESATAVSGALVPAFEHPLIMPMPQPREEARAALTCVAFGLDSISAKPLVRLLPPEIVLRMSNDPRHSRVRRLLSDSDFHLDAVTPGGTAFVNRIADLCFVEAIRSFAGSADREGDKTTSALGNLQISRALRLIHAKPEHAWSIPEIAGQVAMSRSAFAAAFVEVVGETPMRYVTRVRMGHAAALLRAGALSISEVAWRTGYDSDSAFGRVFRRHLGMTPSFYRRTRGVA